MPSEIKAYEYSDGWRCGVEWMLSWGRGGSVLGRGTNAEEAIADFRRRADDDGLTITER